MKELYVRPLAELVSFAPAMPIALEEPGWGWKDDVFGSVTETKPELSEGVEEGWN